MPVAIILAFQVSLSGLPQDMAEGCTDKEGTFTLSSCYTERTEAWEERLRTAYQAALEYVKGPQRQALIKAQSAWSKYRSATCEFYGLTPGSIRYIQSAYCMLDLTRHRALELEEFALP